MKLYGNTTKPITMAVQSTQLINGNEKSLLKIARKQAPFSPKPPQTTKQAYTQGVNMRAVPPAACGGGASESAADAASWERTVPRKPLSEPSGLPGCP